MPAFPNPSSILTRENAVNAILTSIALEEIALSHIINAEGEKIQYALEKIKTSQKPEMQTVLDVNQSVANMLGRVTDMQLVLTNKLDKVIQCLPKEPAEKRPPAPPPCKPYPGKICPYKCV